MQDVTTPVDRAIAAFQAGRMVVILDGADRENEGDLALAAEFATPEAVNFMLTHARGLLCLAITGERLDTLGLPNMVARADAAAPAFTVTVDARRGIGSGTSAHDRAHTMQTLLDPSTQPDDLISPGHVFPLRYATGGVLRRPGHTEASVDLARLAGLQPAAAICEVLNADGSMARPADLRVFAAFHGLQMVTIEDIIAYRRRVERGPLRLVPAGVGVGGGAASAWRSSSAPEPA